MYSYPRKWFIRRTINNYKTINNSRIGKILNLYEKDGILHGDLDRQASRKDIDYYMNISSSPPKECTEISLDEFMQYITNEPLPHSDLFPIY